MSIDLVVLESPDSYSQHFMDAGLWEPYVRQVCHRHHLDPCQDIRPGLAGTYPTFIVNDRWVIKFFGRLFDGALSFAVEQEAARLVTQALPVPALTFLASGNLFPRDAPWQWPYLVSAFVPGVSIGEVLARLSSAAKHNLVAEMGQVVRAIHHISLQGSTVFPPRWQGFLDFLDAQRQACYERHRAWGSLPPRLLRQLEEFLLPTSSLVDVSYPPHLVHADITRDHLLGVLAGDSWVTRALIDWGDAMVGNIYYELLALHLDLFGCELPLLRGFLNSYGFSKTPDFPRKAMTMSLLHQYNVMDAVTRWCPKALDSPTLADLADILWNPS